MNRASASLLALLGVALLAPPRPAGADEGAFEAAWNAKVERLVGGLEDLVARAQKSKLFRFRDATCEQILRFVPDHAAARKWLKYKRAQDGRWTRRGRYKPPRNLSTTGLSEWEERRAAVGDAFAESALSLLGRFEDLPPHVRSRAIRDVVLVAPQREDARRANGEQRTAEGTWLLVESVRALDRRRALATAAQHALDAVPAPRVARPTAAENAIRLGWTEILDGSRVRMMGTVPRDELGRAHRAAEACFGLFEKAFDLVPPRINGLTLYVVTSADEKSTLLANHPGSDEEFAARAARRSSGWFPKSTLVFVSDPSAARRLEWCTRQPIGSMLRRQFGITSRHGWAFEGVGLYLSHLLTGTRSTFFVRPTKYEDSGARKESDLWKRLRAENSDWRDEARTLLASADAPHLGLLLGKGTDTMSIEDMLYAYVVAAYCLEGLPEKTPPLLAAIGKEKATSVDAVRTKLGLDVEGLDERVKRWLEETR